jgi:phospholipase C
VSFVNLRLFGIAFASALLAACSGGGGGGGGGNFLAGGPVPMPLGTPIAGSPIQHVIVVIQENRSFDNLFNGFPNADSVQTGLDHNNNPVTLKPEGLEWTYDPSHAHPSLVTEYNNGAMNGFDLDTCDFNPFNASNNFDCTGFIFGPPADFTYSFVPGPTGLNNNSETLTLWLLAGWFPGKGYGLADRMFASRQVPSFPGHQFLIAGQGPADDPNSSLGLTNGIWGCDAPVGTTAGQFGPTYVSPEVFTFPCYNYQTIGDLLDAKNVPWKYYTGAIGTVDGLISGYDAISHIRYGPDWATKISTPPTSILDDIQNTTLPPVSFVTPVGPASDHAGFVSSAGPGWVSTIYLYVEQNPKLSANTAILVTWDDSGGWYDHVAPPSDGFGPLGFRVPLVVISPYAVRGVSHVQHDYGSILHFIEKNWNLGSLGQRDALADDLSDMFNYSQTPIQPLTSDQLFMNATRPYSKAYFQNLHGNHPVDDDR